MGLVHAGFYCGRGPQLRHWGSTDSGDLGRLLIMLYVLGVSLVLRTCIFFVIDKRKNLQVLLQPQSPLTNPGRINKKHKGEEEEVHFDSESDDDCTIGRISTNVFDENV